MIFILLALFASWPYFEKFIEYHWLKKVWIGASILLLLGLGIMDILSSDQQAKADKLEISQQINKISTLSSQTKTLSDTVNDLSNQLKKLTNKEDGRDKKEDERFKKQLNSFQILLIQQRAGDIHRAKRDTNKD